MTDVLPSATVVAVTRHSRVGPVPETRGAVPVSKVLDHLLDGGTVMFSSYSLFALLSVRLRSFGRDTYARSLDSGRLLVWTEGDAR